MPLEEAAEKLLVRARPGATGVQSPNWRRSRGAAAVLIPDLRLDRPRGQLPCNAWVDMLKNTFRTVGREAKGDGGVLEGCQRAHIQVGGCSAVQIFTIILEFSHGNYEFDAEI